MRASWIVAAALRMGGVWLLFTVIFPCSTCARPAAPETDSRDARAVLRGKLETIRIQRIEFDETPVESAVAFLVEESRAADPARKGVNIVLVIPQPLPGAEKTGAIPKTVTLNLRNVPLLGVIRYMTQMMGLQYHVEADAVIIAAGSSSRERLETRTFSVAPGLFNSLRSKTD